MTTTMKLEATNLCKNARTTSERTAYRRLEDIDVTNPHDCLVIISPDMARLVLDEMNSGNRLIREKRVKYFERLIIGGEWQPDHPEPIVFSRGGRLLDGQHRFKGIMLGGIEVVAHCRFGVRDELFKWINAAEKRAIHDRVEFVDFSKSVNKVCATLVNTYRRLHISKTEPTPFEVEHIYLAHKDAISWAAQIYHSRKRSGIRRAAVYVALVEFYEINRTAAEKFAESMCVPDGDVQPARMLRDYILLNPADTGHGDAIRNAYERAVYCMKAALAGKNVTSVRRATWK